MIPSKQFLWCESRPDGRRAIKNHQEAHARGIRNARKVVDTSMPKFFKTRFERGKGDGKGHSALAPSTLDDTAQLAAGLLTRSWSTPLAASADVPPYCPTPAAAAAAAQHPQPSAAAGAVPAAALPHTAPKQKQRPLSAPMTAHPRVSSEQGAPLPTAGSPTRSVVLLDERNQSARSAAAEVAAAQHAGDAYEGGGGGGACGAGVRSAEPSCDSTMPADRQTRPGDAASVVMSAEQLSSFQEFVSLLAAFTPHDAGALLTQARAEAQERRLFANYG